MAAKLQCEICGGKLVGKPGGIFECEFCGTEYSTEWAKAKIQEITGTVKVEGTVDVKGTVQVEGTANVQSLIKRGKLALEDSKWDEAKQCFNDALNIDPENADAYLGLVMTNYGYHNREELAEQYVDINFDIKKLGSEFDRAKQFGNNELISWIGELDRKRELAFDENKKRLASVRQRLKKYQGILFAEEHLTIGKKEDGTILIAGKKDGGQSNISELMDIVSKTTSGFHIIGIKPDGEITLTPDDKVDSFILTDVISYAEGWFHKAFLKEDGTVVNVANYGDDWHEVKAVSLWSDIVAIAAGAYFTVGLTSDGRVVNTANNPQQTLRWRNVVAIAAGDNHIVGLKSDGTVVAAKCSFEAEDACKVTDWKLFKTEEENKVDYDKACALQESGEERKLAEAASIFRGLKDYQDSADRAVECDHGYKETDYLKACELQTSGKENDLERAAILFDFLDGYKDSEQRISECWDAYKELKADREKREKAEREAREARERAERAAAEEKARQERVASLNSEKSALQAELANLKGLFTGKRRKEIENQLDDIEVQLSWLQQKRS